MKKIFAKWILIDAVYFFLFVFSHILQEQEFFCSYSNQGSISDTAGLRQFYFKI